MSKTFAVHPGEILLHEFMEPADLTLNQLADEIGVPLPEVDDLVRCRRGISEDLATRLSQRFETSVQFWINLQFRNSDT